MIGEKNHAFKA